MGGFQVNGAGVKSTLTVDLRYYEGRPVIREIKRSSRPGLRRYEGKETLPKVQGGLGIAIISTSKGLMTDREARKAESVAKCSAPYSKGVYRCLVLHFPDRIAIWC